MPVSFEEPAGRPSSSNTQDSARRPLRSETADTAITPSSKEYLSQRDKVRRFLYKRRFHPVHSELLQSLFHVGRHNGYYELDSDDSLCDRFDAGLGVREKKRQRKFTDKIRSKLTPRKKEITVMEEEDFEPLIEKRNTRVSLKTRSNILEADLKEGWKRGEKKHE